MLSREVVVLDYLVYAMDINVMLDIMQRLIGNLLLIEKQAFFKNLNMRNFYTELTIFRYQELYNLELGNKNFGIRNLYTLKLKILIRILLFLC
jgi:hypothetical protein